VGIIDIDDVDWFVREKGFEYIAFGTETILKYVEGMLRS